MYNKFTDQQHINRHGFYTVGNKKFFNKTLALIEASSAKLPVTWNFNQDVYGKINWSIPIEESLEELYRKRAQQLRDQYDYLVLHFSGGADSANILHAFVKNNIFLDEIVMQYPKNYDHVANNTDTSGNNNYSEIPYSASIIINELKKSMHTNTVIRYQDILEPANTVYKKDNWFELMPLGTNISITGAARQYAQHTDPTVLELCSKGVHVAQILGVDKPLVHFNGDDYYAYFLDSNATHQPPVDINDLYGNTNFYHCEFFYWTPAMPEIVVKQAQEIKRIAENNPAVKIAISQHQHIGKMRDVLHPIIYPVYVKLPFQADKISVGNVRRPADNWFWKTATDELKHNYLNAIKYLDQTIDQSHFSGVDIYHGGFSSLASDYYRL